MSTFFGVIRYEYTMSIRRLGFWLAFGGLGAFTVLSELPFQRSALSAQELWQYAGTFSFQLNVLLPVIGGIVLADRLVRDHRLGVHELLHSTALKRWTYLLGKYAGGLLSVLTPIFLITVLSGVLAGLGSGQWEAFPALLVTFLAINVPAFVFITAFSLACPVVIPVRVYQILFTGYWFWGNFLAPQVMPTLNGTLLTASGEFALFGFFGGWIGLEPGQLHSAADAVLNLIVLGLCASAALVMLERFLAWRAHRG